MPKKLFEDSVGIVMVSTVQLGFLLAGTVGTGIVLKKIGDEKWSPPCAVGMSGLGFGLLLGASAKDLVIFIMDDITMESLTTTHGATLGSQLEVTLGPLGRNVTADYNFSKKGIGATVAVAYSKGIFAGLSIEGAKLGVREFVNNKFYAASSTPAQDIPVYSSTASAKDILEGKVAVPSDKVTMLDEVYDKLNKLQQGATAEPDAKEESKKKAAKEAADKEAESIKGSPEVVQVDAAAEAAKEG